MTLPPDQIPPEQPDPITPPPEIIPTSAPAEDQVFRPNIIEEEAEQLQHNIERGKKKLIVMGILMIVASLISLILLIATGIDPNDNQGFSIGNSIVSHIVLHLFSFALQSLILAGGICMLKVKNRSFCIASTICALVPCACCFVLNIPVGIVSLVFLCQADVKACFDQNTISKQS